MRDARGAYVVLRNALIRLSSTGDARHIHIVADLTPSEMLSEAAFVALMS